jgi:hypothetical protein
MLLNRSIFLLKTKFYVPVQRAQYFCFGAIVGDVHIHWREAELPSHQQIVPYAELEEVSGVKPAVFIANMLQNHSQ